MHACIYARSYLIISPAVWYVKCACGVFIQLHHLGHEALSFLRLLELIFIHLFILFVNAAFALPEDLHLKTIVCGNCLGKGVYVIMCTYVKNINLLQHCGSSVSGLYIAKCQHASSHLLLDPIKFDVFLIFVTPKHSVRHASNSTLDPKKLGAGWCWFFMSAAMIPDPALVFLTIRLHTINPGP